MPDSQPQPQKLRVVPRVPGRRLLGNLVEFWRRPVGFLADAYHTHGSVFRFDLPTSHSVVIGGPDARDFLLADDRKPHTPQPGASPSESRCPMTRLGLFRPFSTEVGLAVFDAEGERHTQLRGLLRLPYSRQITAQFAPEMEQVVADVVADWTPGQSVDLFATSCQLALHAMMTVVTPIQMRQFTADIVKAGNRVMYTQFRLLPESTLKTPDYLKARARMAAIIDEAIERHQAGEFATEAKVHLIDACLQATNDNGDRMDLATTRAVCFYALAGTEIYMGRLVCFLVYELLKNRQYLQQVLAEIDSTEPNDDLSNAFRRMPHLRAAYLEALRCYPLIPGYSYVTTEATEVLGHAVQKGEQLVFAPYLGHYSHEHYANPTAFDASRHTQPRREFARSGFFVPFGVGRHACAAPGMVETVILSLVTGLLRRVDLQLERPSYQMNLRLDPLISPTEPLNVRVLGQRRPMPKNAAESFLAETGDFHRADQQPDWLEQLPHKQPEKVQKGHQLIDEGAHADTFFVLLEGTMSVWKQTAKGEERIATKEPGSCFGEIGLLKKIPRTASVRAETEALVLRFTAAEFEKLIGENDLTADDLRSLYYARHIKSLLKESLQGLSEAVAPQAMRWRPIAKGEYMFRQGEPSDAFYIIVEGTAEVLVERTSPDRATETKLVAKLGPGSFFGEIGILKAQPRGASVRAETPLKTLSIDREVFLATIREKPAALSDLALITCQRLLAQVQMEA